MIKVHSGLPVALDARTGALAFGEGLQCAGCSEKSLGAMAGLLRDPSGIDPDATAYRAYRDIRFERDAALFARLGLRYDITVILPGPVNGEFRKTSGHYHGRAPGGPPYPEVYEVIEGEIVFILQRNAGFDRADGGRIDEVRAVHVKAGQAIIVPPYCGHGSVNPTGRAAAFSNLAVVACPLDYAPIAQRRGLAAYIMAGRCGDRAFMPVANPNYADLPPVRVAEPLENPALGIEFGTPCYRNFVEHPERYDFLLHPERHLAKMDAMTREL